MKKLKLVNLDYLISISDGSNELVKALIEAFIEQINVLSLDMKKALNNKNWMSLKAQAHKAKSSVAMFGMTETAGLLSTLEDLADKSEKVDTYPKFVDQFTLSTTEAVKELTTVSEHINRKWTT